MILFTNNILLYKNQHISNKMPFDNQDKHFHYVCLRYKRKNQDLNETLTNIYLCPLNYVDGKYF